MTSRTDTTEVTLTEAQRVYLRMVLFNEMRDAAETLAHLASGAAEGSTDEQVQAIAELDTHSAYDRRVVITAELLDAVGWGGGE